MKNPERNLLVMHIQQHLAKTAFELPEGTRIVVSRRRFLKLKKVLGESPVFEHEGQRFTVVEDRSLSDDTLRFTDE